jgi:hypothetical protein
VTRALALLVLLVAAVVAPGGVAGAVTSAAVVADAVDATGSYLEVPADDELQTVIAEANRQGIGFARLSGSGDAVIMARQVSAELGQRRSGYTTVVVLTADAVGAAAWRGTAPIAEILAPGAPAFEAFARGAEAEGLRLFTRAVTGGPMPGEPAPPVDQPGRGVPWAALLAVIGLLGIGAGAWLLVRERGRRREEAAGAETRRAAIGEQLRDNADRIITLGDAVVSSGRSDLVDLYDEASAAYRDVSHRLDAADSPEALERLDRRLDVAEWQLQVIEARLAGRTPPPPPAEGGAPPVASPGSGPAPPPSSADQRPRHEGPALGPDQSLFGQGRPPGPPPRDPERP